MNYLPIIQTSNSRFSVIIAADMNDNLVNLPGLAFCLVKSTEKERRAQIRILGMELRSIRYRIGVAYGYNLSQH
jgi:hypothetical protein